MSIQELSAEIPRLSIYEQLRLLELLTTSLRSRFSVEAISTLSNTSSVIRPIDDAPLNRLIGIGRSGEGDLAEKHDDYLYGPRSNPS